MEVEVTPHLSQSRQKGDALVWQRSDRSGLECDQIIKKSALTKADFYFLDFVPVTSAVA